MFIDGIVAESHPVALRPEALDEWKADMAAELAAATQWSLDRATAT